MLLNPVFGVFLATLAPATSGEAPAPALQAQSAVSPAPAEVDSSTELAPERAQDTVGEGKQAVVAPALPTPERVAHINRIWRGVGLGYANGLWGSSFGQSLRVDVPFGRKVGQFAGVRVEGRLIHPPAGTGGFYDPVVHSGLSFWGRGPVWLGLVRVYGGGGAWVGVRPNPVEGEQLGFSGGGYFGVEFLVASRMSFTFEVGGQGPAHRFRQDDAGGSAMAGFMVYLGAIGQGSR